MAETKSPEGGTVAGAPSVPAALLLFHRLLSSPQEPETISSLAAELQETLAGLGADEAASALEKLNVDAVGAERWRSAWTALFVRGEVPPYETSHMAPSMAGHLGEMADIAGFYKAFGVEAQGERPDHLLPELEFLTFLCFKYAEAVEAGQEEAAQTCEEAMASFLEDHLGTWLGAFSGKLAAERPGHPYLPVVGALQAFVAWLCKSLDLSPRPVESVGIPGVHPGSLLGDQAGLLGDECEPRGCFGTPLPGERELQIPG